MAVVQHNEHLADRVTMAGVRADLSLQPKLAFEPASREVYDAIIGSTALAEDVRFEAAAIGGVNGWWCLPEGADPTSAIVHVHGGGYVLGSAVSYRNFIGNLAARARVAAFLPDYALAPERPFPAAYEEVQAVLGALEAAGRKRLVVTGDSAGGGLALAVAQAVVRKSRTGLVGVAAFSPWTDLTLTSTSFQDRADADPLLSRDTLLQAANLYVGSETDRSDPRISPRFGKMAGLPPLMLHVGADEVLHDDAVGFADAAEAAGVDAQVHVWAGMTHVFPASVATLHAAREALDLSAAFLSNCLEER